MALGPWEALAVGVLLSFPALQVIKEGQELGPSGATARGVRSARAPALLRDLTDPQRCVGQDGATRPRPQFTDDHVEHLRARVAGRAGPHPRPGRNRARYGHRLTGPDG